jgi:hypothetical protein
MKKKTNYVAKTYKLKSDATPLNYMLSSRNSSRFPLLWFDEDKGINRPLRYARNQKSPFEDEQDGNAILEPIVFEDGFLFVPKENQILQEFLSYHPQKDYVFQEVDKARDANEEVEWLDYVLTAQVTAKELSIEKLSSIGRVLFGQKADKMSTAELRRDVLIYAQQDPQDFLDTIDDPMVSLQDEVVQFVSNGLLLINNKKVNFNLPGNKKKLMTVPFGEDAHYILASYMQSDEGVEVYKLLKRHLEKIK